MNETLQDLNTSTVYKVRNYNFDVSALHNYYPHIIIPSLVLNKVASETPETFEGNTFNIQSSLPMPSGLPTFLTEEILNGIDPVVELVNEKKKWITQRYRLITANVKGKRYASIKRTERNKMVPCGTLRLAEHLEMDPDPDFSSPYNWYYTDGCLNTVVSKCSNLLAMARHNIPGIIAVKPLSEIETNALLSSGNERFLHTDSTQPILQITSNRGFIGCRQKNNSCLFSIENETQKMKRCHRHNEKNESIVSISINQSHRGEYCTLSSTKKIKVWKPELENIPKIEGKIENSDNIDGWGNVKYVDDNKVIVADRNFVYLKDLRYKLDKKNGTCWSKKYTEKCEEICQLILSQHTYVATTHNLLELDFRNGFTKRWTHMMESQPLIGFSNFLYNNEEYIFLGSQNINEVCCIAVNSQSLPTILPSPNETLVNARFRGCCLDPNTSVRFNLSMVGLTSLPSKDNGVYLIRSTSVGDTFYQRVAVNQENIDRSDFDIGALNRWEAECKKANQNVSCNSLNITSVKDNTLLFNSVIERSKRSQRLPRKNVNLQNAPWKMSKHKMVNSKDVFTDCLLDVWDIDDDSEWCHKRSAQTKKRQEIAPEENVGARVSTWLNNAPETEPDPLEVNVENDQEALLDKFDSNEIKTRDKNKINDLASVNARSIENNMYFHNDLETGLDEDNEATLYINRVKPKKSIPSTVRRNMFNSGF